jgi:hypothetical protein
MLLVTGGMLLDISEESGLDTDAWEGEQNDVGVARSGDSSVGVNGNGGGNSDGSEGGNGVRWTEARDDADGGKGGRTSENIDGDQINGISEGSEGKPSTLFVSSSESSFTDDSVGVLCSDGIVGQSSAVM